MKILKKIICFFRSHKRGETWFTQRSTWLIECSRCGKIVEYRSPRARLVGTEMLHGFDGK